MVMGRSGGFPSDDQYPQIIRKFYWEFMGFNGDLMRKLKGSDGEKWDIMVI